MEKSYGIPSVGVWHRSGVVSKNSDREIKIRNNGALVKNLRWSTKNDLYCCMGLPAIIKNLRDLTVRIDKGGCFAETRKRPFLHPPFKLKGLFLESGIKSRGGRGFSSKKLRKVWKKFQRVNWGGKILRCSRSKMISYPNNTVSRESWKAPWQNHLGSFGFQSTKHTNWSALMNWYFESRESHPSI